MSVDDEIEQLKRQLRDLEERKRAEASTEAQDNTAADEASPIAPPPPKRLAKAKENGLLKPVYLIGGAISAIFLTLIALMANQPERPKTSPGPIVEEVASSTVDSAKAAEPASRWLYTEDVDPMNDKKTFMACVMSDDKVILSPPYEPTNAQLCVRNSAKFGVDTFFQLVSDGQIICTSYDGCTGHVRFDSGPRQAFSMAEPASMASNMLFFQSGRKVANLLARSKAARVELTYYQAGVQSVGFQTGDLDLNRLGLGPKP